MLACEVARKLSVRRRRCVVGEGDGLGGDAVGVGEVGVHVDEQAPAATVGIA